MLVHAITRKGKGFKIAGEHEKDQSHVIRRVDEITRWSLSDTARTT